MTRDELRDKLWGVTSPTAVDEDILPIIDAYVAAERERMAQAIEAIRTDGRSDPMWEIGHRAGLDDAACIVRDGGAQ